VTLAGARVALGATRAERINITIRNGRIAALGNDTNVRAPIDLSGHLILPGLINAHDHLEFNLFPRLGRGPYPNASAWAADIYHPTEPPIRDHLRIPKATRLFWGGFKNLLSGVTTVAHHNPYEPDVFTPSFPVRVVQRFGWAHSLDFSPDVRERFRVTPRRWPFIIHAGEGTDQRSRDELCRLQKLRMLGPRTVLVHAVAADAVAVRNAAVIWCPSSNLFTLGKTIDPAILRGSTRVALGSDSAMTGQGDLLDELRAARAASELNPERLYRMVTSDAASILRLTQGEGTIAACGGADLLVVRDLGLTPAETLLNALPEMVIVAGKVRLASPVLAQQLNAPMQRIEVDGRGAWLTDLNIRAAFDATSQVLGNDIRLAGRSVRT